MPPGLETRAIAAQIAQWLNTVGFYWLLGAGLLVLFAWQRRRRLFETVILVAAGWLLLRALSLFLPVLTPCLAPNADLALGLLVTAALSYLLPLRRWQRFASLLLLALAAAVQAYALGCTIVGSPGLWLALGLALGALLLAWVLGRWRTGRRFKQRMAMRVDTWSTVLARVPVSVDIRGALQTQLCRHLGLAVAHLEPLAADGAHTSTPIVVQGITPAGEQQRYFIKIITQRNWQGALVHWIALWLQHRDRMKTGPLWPTLKALAEHEHYMGLIFDSLGVPVPPPHGLYRLDDAVYALVTEYLEGAHPLRSLGGMSRDFVAAGFLALRRLRAADLAHRDIKASNIMVLPNDGFAFVDLAAAVSNAGPRRLDEDLADLLAIMAMHHPPEDVVAIARSVLGQAVLRRTLPYLHHATLNSETQKMVPLTLPRELRRLIFLGGQPEEVPSDETRECPIGQPPG